MEVLTINHQLILATINTNNIVNLIFTFFMLGLIIYLVIYIGGIVLGIILIILQIAFIPIRFLLIVFRFIGNFTLYLLALIFICYQKITKNGQPKESNYNSNRFFNNQQEYKSKNSNQQSKEQQRTQQNYSYSSNIDSLEKYRKILDVKKGASNEEIKKHYREMVKKYHPDKNHDPQASIKFKEIVNAYEHLIS